MTSDRAQLEVILRGDISQFQRAMHQGTREVVGFEKAVGQSSSSVSTFASSARTGFLAASAAVTGTVAALAGVTSVTKSAIAAASNLGEQQSKVNVVFGDSAASVLKWAESSAQSMGIARAEATAAAGTFGNLFTAMGLSQQAAAEMSPRLIQLAADLASFNNASPEETLQALQSGLVGEVEPMRRFGVAINAAAVEAKALEMGLARTKAEISEADKVTARYQLILENTKNAQGDFARTSDSLANQQRILKAEIGTLAEKFGTALLPAAKNATTAIVGLLEKNGDKWAREFASGVDALSSSLNTLAGYKDAVSWLIYLSPTGGGAGGLGRGIADRIKGAIGGIFDIEGNLGMDYQRRFAGSAPLTAGSIEADGFTRGGPLPNTFGQTLFDAQGNAMGGASSGALADILGRNKATAEDVAKAQADLWVASVTGRDTVEKFTSAVGAADDRMTEAFDLTTTRNLQLAHKTMEEAELAAAAAAKTLADAAEESAQRMRAGIDHINGLNQQGVKRYAPGVFETIAGAFGLNTFSSDGGGEMPMNVSPA